MLASRVHESRFGKLRQRCKLRGKPGEHATPESGVRVSVLHYHHAVILRDLLGGIARLEGDGETMLEDLLKKRAGPAGQLHLAAERPVVLPMLGLALFAAVCSGKGCVVAMGNEAAGASLGSAFGAALGTSLGSRRLRQESLGTDSNRHRLGSREHRRGLIFSSQGHPAAVPEQAGLVAVVVIRHLFGQSQYTELLIEVGGRAGLAVSLFDVLQQEFKVGICGFWACGFAIAKEKLAG